jgi:hypothetical protein
MGEGELCEKRFIRMVGCHSDIIFLTFCSGILDLVESCPSCHHHRSFALHQLIARVY